LNPALTACGGHGPQHRGRQLGACYLRRVPPARILIVDDEEEIADLLGECLIDAGYEVTLRSAARPRSTSSLACGPTS
jgi:PleD family two-component response regulator